jgi:N-carbamoyl-L-amino-acid hydrolase
MVVEIDADRLREDIEANGEIGKVAAESGWGRTVLTGTEADKRARDRFADTLADSGLEVRIDAIGNVAGRWTPANADPSDPPVVAGSHLDSVTNGGIFDGPLGVYAALESVRSMQESDRRFSRPVEVVSWTEEEGVRFGTGLLGSSVATGARPLEEALSLQDREGTTLAEELDRIGYRGNDRIDPSSWDAWLELHVEQGPELVATGNGVGVVGSIAGIANCRVVFDGEADHAGSTPMYQRTDALTAASEFVLDTERIGRNLVDAGHESAVATIGSFSVSPNANNVIPDRVELVMDVRDVDLKGIETIVDRARANANRIATERDVAVSFDHYRLTEPCDLDDRCIDAARRAAVQCDIDALDMVSPALHDTANVSAVTDAVLLFAPSENGVSHHPNEWTDWDDCAAATQVLATTIAELASG